MWQGWINVILGIWIIVVPFLDMSTNALKWVLVITGAVVALLALWGANMRSET
jgi:hypothetical protein